MKVSWRGDSSSREREKGSDGIWEFTKETRNGASQNIPGKGENPFKKQTLLSLDSSFLLSYFLWACEYTSFIKLEMVRWREKGRRGGRQAGGNERLYPLTISAVTGLPAPEGEGGGGSWWSAKAEEGASSLAQRGQGKAPLRKPRDRFWWWCQKWSICLLRTLPSGTGGRSQSASSLCNRRGRKWAGRVKLSGKSHIWRTRAREETGRNMQAWYPGWGRHRILRLHGVLWFTKHRPQHTETSQGLGRPAHYHDCPGEETVTQK